MNEDVYSAVERIGAVRPADYRLGVVLGSGLGGLADEVEDRICVPYGDVPGFPASGVSSHRGELVLGRLGGCEAVLLAGRAHYYEHGDARAMALPIRVLKALGCGALLVTNAAGSLRDDLPPGSLMLITDHINFSGRNPLIGESGDDRFVDMSAAYDTGLRDLLRAGARDAAIALGAGVYMWFSGPSFETPAEVRMAARLGADAVGMSTVSEVILARHAGLRVAGVSLITNLAAGLSDAPLSHEETKAVAGLAAADMAALVTAFAARFADER